MADTTGNGLILNPTFTLAGTGVMGVVGTGGGVVLPSLTLSGSSGGVRLPSLALAATGKSGTITATPPFNGHSIVPMLRLSGTGVSQELTSGNGAISLPFLQVTGYDKAAFLLVSGVRLPVLTLAATGLTGEIGNGKLSIPVFQVASGGFSNTLGNGAASIPLLTVAGSGLSGTTGNLRAQLGRLILAARGVSGTIGSGVLRLPIVLVAGTGYGSTVTGQVNILLPMLRLHATDGEPLAPGLGAGAALVWHTQIGAMTTYSSFPFNSFALANGVYLGANANGIFALEGDTDAGVAIAASVAFGATDFGDEHMKRVTAAYVGYRTSGELRLTVTTDEHQEYQYTLEPSGQAGLHANRVKLGKGAKGRYWQARIDNRDGASFDLDQITLTADVLSRKIG